MARIPGIKKILKTCWNKYALILSSAEKDSWNRIEFKHCISVLIQCFNNPHNY